MKNFVIPCKLRNFVTIINLYSYMQIELNVKELVSEKRCLCYNLEWLFSIT